MGNKTSDANGQDKLLVELWKSTMEVMKQLKCPKSISRRPCDSLAVPFPIKISANMKCLARLFNKAEASDKISDSQKEVLTVEAPEDQEVDLVEAEDKILKMETMTTSIIKEILFVARF